MGKRLNRLFGLNLAFSKYLSYSFPFVIFVVIWGNFQSQEEIIKLNNTLVYYAWEVLSWNLMLWFVLFCYFLFSLLLSEKLRIAIFKKIGKIKERDEREQAIVNIAGKKSFFVTLAFLFFLFFFSMFSFEISRLPHGKTIDNHKHNVSIGLSFRIFDVNEAHIQKRPEDVLVKYKMPFSKEFILFLIILIYIITFYYSTYRALRR